MTRSTSPHDRAQPTATRNVREAGLAPADARLVAAHAEFVLARRNYERATAELRAALRLVQRGRPRRR